MGDGRLKSDKPLRDSLFQCTNVTIIKLHAYEKSWSSCWAVLDARRTTKTSLLHACRILIQMACLHPLKLRLIVHLQIKTIILKVVTPVIELN